MLEQEALSICFLFCNEKEADTGLNLNKLEISLWHNEKIA